MEQTNGHNTEQGWQNNATKWIIPGVAIGAAIGIAYAATRRKRNPWEDRWETAKDVGEKLYDKRDDLAEHGRNMLDRIRLIYDEGRKVVEEATELWSLGRKLVRG